MAPYRRHRTLLRVFKQITAHVGGKADILSETGISKQMRQRVDRFLHGERRQADIHAECP